MSKEKQSRKEFLQKGAAVAAGLIAMPYIVPASARGKGGRVAPSDRIVMGGIGLNSMGAGDMGQFLDMKNVQYVALCDVDRKVRDNSTNRINEHYGTKDARSYNDFREFLEKEKLDAIHTALPDHWHAIPTILAAQKGINIYGQKPMARSIKESRAIVDAVTKYDIVWQTGSQQRSEDQFLQACDIIRSGKLGKIDHVTVGLPNGGNSKGQPTEQSVPDGVDWDMWLGPAPAVPYRGILHGDWRWMLDYSGGQLTDWAGHHIDIALWSMGLNNTGPTEVEAEGQYLTNDIFNVPIGYDIHCKFTDGLKLRVANEGRLADQARKLGRKNDKGQIRTDHNGTAWYGEKGWLYVERGGIWAENPEILDAKFAPSTRIYDTMGLNHHQNFIDCIRTGRKTIAPAEDGHRAISIALLGEIAMTTNQKLFWDPNKERFIDDAPKATAMLMKPYRDPWKLPKI